VRQAYTEAVEQLGGKEPYLTLTVQLTFIVYLLLGQLVVLLGWRLIAPALRKLPTWLGNTLFGIYLLGAQALLFLGWPLLGAAWLQADNALLADLVVIVHLGLVLGVLLVLVLIPVGWLFGWRWTRNFWLRLTHLVIIEVVAGQAIVGIECPLKTLERQLRGGPGELHNFEGASQLGRWCNEILYWRGELWVFLLIYSSVGLLVLLTFVLLPPRLPWRTEPQPLAEDEANEAPQPEPVSSGG
jgi:hypothetical protein